MPFGCSPGGAELAVSCTGLEVTGEAEPEMPVCSWGKGTWTSGGLSEHDGWIWELESPRAWVRLVWVGCSGAAGGSVQGRVGCAYGQLPRVCSEVNRGMGGAGLDCLFPALLGVVLERA